MTSLRKPCGPPVALGALTLLQACGQQPTPRVSVDVVITNANVLTVDDAFSTARTMALRGGRIVAVTPTSTRFTRPKNISTSLALR